MEIMKIELRSAFLLVACLFSWLLFSQTALAQPANDVRTVEKAQAEKEEKLDLAKLIFEEILDNHEYHIAEINGRHLALPLPVLLYSPQRGVSVFLSSKFQHGKAAYNGYRLEEHNIVAVHENGAINDTVKVYDFSLTRNVVQMMLAAGLLFFLLQQVAKQYKKRGAGLPPTGFQNAVEAVITFVRDEVAKPNLGLKYERYMPFLLSVFFFILVNNLLGLIPLSAKVTGNIAVTLVLAFISLVVILLSTNRHYWSHLFWPEGIPLPVKFILVPVELLGLFIRPAALMIRLFANMIAGHIVIISFISLIFIFAALSTVAGWGFLPVSIGFTVFIYLLEVLVAFIQAFIFTNLTAVFIGQSFGTGHEQAAKQPGTQQMSGKPALPQEATHLHKNPVIT